VVDVCIQLTELTLPDLEIAVAWVNAGKAFEKLNDIDQALDCFNKAIEIENRHNRFYFAEIKAAFLANIGRISESMEMYDKIVQRPDLYIADYQRISANLEAIRGRLQNR
jgi:tetratricopeptide (TPR) repeat protein